MFEASFIVSQILMAIAFIITSSAFQVKKGKLFRIMFATSALFIGVHFYLLGSMTAAIISLVNGTRWLTSAFYQHKFLPIIFIIIGVSLGVLTMNGIVSVLPIIAGILGTISAFQKKEKHTRRTLMGATSLWVVHNSLIFTPVGIISECIFLISNLIGYRRNFLQKRVDTRE